MKKLNCVIAGYPDSYSEYGKLTVNLLEALLAVRGDIWNITIVNASDASTSMGYIDDHEWVKEYLVEVINTQPDIWIQIGAPEQYARHGILFNIGITACNVSNVITRRVIDGINRMDLVLPINELGYDIIVNTVLEYRGTAEVSVKDKVAIPVEKLTIGVNSVLDNYKKITMLSQIKEDYCFIYNGLWKNPIDLNNVGKLIYSFYGAFKDVKSKPALVIKTNVNTPSIVDGYRIENRIKEIKSKYPSNTHFPNVYLINGNLSDQSMMGIYNNPKIKCMVSASSNETIGLNLKEFQLTGKPIITGSWGGHTELGEYLMSVNTDMVEVDPSLKGQDLIAPNSKYGSPDLSQLASAMHFAFTNKVTPKGKFKFNSNVTRDSLDSILSKYILNTTKSNYIPESEEFEL